MEEANLPAHESNTAAAAASSTRSLTPTSHSLPTTANADVATCTSLSPMPITTSITHAAANLPKHANDDSFDIPDDASLSVVYDPCSQLICIPFDIGNPAVEIITGRIYLTYNVREVQDTDDTDAEGILPFSTSLQDEDEEEKKENRSLPPTSSSAASTEEFKSKPTKDEELLQDEDDEISDEDEDHRDPHINIHSTCLTYLFDIPAHLTLNELHHFLINSSCFTQLLHLQLLRIPSRKTAASSDTTYSALLQFRTPAAASQFVHEYDGVPFNSLEPEKCSAGFVEKVVFDEEDKYSFPIAAATVGSRTTTPLPSLTLGKTHSRETIPHSPSAVITNALINNAANVPSSTLALPPSVLPSTPSFASCDATTTAISSTSPSCPVCLELILPSSLSNPTPMLTILCHHVFHFDCLSKWIPSSSSPSCPVCRYLMQPNVNTECQTCKATEKLWLCIICGHVGCSRRSLGHALQHYEQTAHNYAIEVLTQRVWDYVSRAINTS